MTYFFMLYCTHTLLLLVLFERMVDHQRFLIFLSEIKYSRIDTLVSKLTIISLILLCTTNFMDFALKLCIDKIKCPIFRFVVPAFNALLFSWFKLFTSRAPVGVSQQLFVTKAGRKDQLNAWYVFRKTDKFANCSPASERIYRI